MYHGVKSRWGSSISRLKANLNRAVDVALPQNAAVLKAANNQTQVAGEAFPEGNYYAKSDDQKYFQPLEEPVKDLAYGIRALFITACVLGSLDLAGFLILLIYRCVIIARGTSAIITIWLVTTFSIFNSDPVNHLDQFYPVVWGTSNYLIDIPLLIMFGVCFLGNLIRVISIWMSGGLLTDHTKKELFIPTGSLLLVDTETVFKEDEYRSLQMGNFYLHQVAEGDFWFRWIVWMLAGGSLLWLIMTLAPIQDSFLLVSLTAIFGSVIILGFLHEHINRIKLTNVNLEQPIVMSDNIPIVNRRAKKAWPFVLALFIHSWIWIVVFVYYGYADNFNSTAYQWFRLAIPPIGIAFYFLLVPLTTALWCFIPFTTKYNEFNRVRTPYQAPGTTDTDIGTPVGGLWTNERDPGKGKSYFDFENTNLSTEEQAEDLRYKQTRVIQYAKYQDWYKNVVYEIVMLSLATLCAHLVAWILWGGMLSQ
jgi:hypothetical protein